MWTCECGCIPGVCDGRMCNNECESHDLDPLNNMQLAYILEAHGRIPRPRLHKVSRNELIRLFAQECPSRVFEKALKYAENPSSLRMYSSSKAPLSVPSSVLTDTQVARLIADHAKQLKVKATKTKAKPTKNAKPTTKSKAKGKPKATIRKTQNARTTKKRKTEAQKRAALARCKT